MVTSKNEPARALETITTRPPPWMVGSSAARGPAGNNDTRPPARHAQIDQIGPPSARTIQRVKTESPSAPVRYLSTKNLLPDGLWRPAYLLGNFRDSPPVFVHDLLCLSMSPPFSLCYIRRR